MTEAPWKGKLRELRQTISEAHDLAQEHEHPALVGKLETALGQVQRLKDAANSGGEGGRVKALEGALDRIMTGGNHLALHIGTDHPPHTASFDEALEHYGPGIRYDIWCCWKNIMDARALLGDKPDDKGE